MYRVFEIYNEKNYSSITSTGWNCDPYPTQSAAYRDSVVEAYRVDVHNLMKRSG